MQMPHPIAERPALPSASASVYPDKTNGPAGKRRSGHFHDRRLRRHAVTSLHHIADTRRPALACASRHDASSTINASTDVAREFRIR
ncbi:hypothetical protein FPJ27_22090 [Burkholderia sp. MS455]|uniref:hypothetical protein n=1 Tax=Burkholderia sp. MS455 TaxID=2811788 RepID=UPI00195E8484|nr:hypothetical protein [Burkholderia sp. MS455]QRR08994.1 hypothetical protein FPJ27_22090 [Burkholderia sp. MS455]